MTNLWMMLFVKSTVVLTAGTIVAALLQSRSAAARHLVWVCVILVLLLLPVGLLVPETVVPSQWYVSVSAAPGGSSVVSGAHSPTLVTIWFAGFVVFVIRLGNAVFRALRVVQRARPSGVVASHPVRITAEIAGPLAWSFGKGTVILPATASNWHEDTLIAAISHESAHLARRDCQALVAAHLACALYWFHPLMWYALRRLRIEQEHATDDAVVRAGIAPADYVQHLVELARLGRTETLLAGVGTSGRLPTRAAIILDEKRKRAVQNRRMVLASFAAIVATAIPLAALQSDKKVYKVSDEGITPPKLLIKQEPNYTQEAREAKIQGTVTVSAIIEINGRLSDIAIKESLDAGLDENAVVALSNWVFKPAEKDGTPVRVSCTIEVNFRLL